MNKTEAINLLNQEGWTKADAQRALEVIDFDTNPDELTIRKAASLFAGTELMNRQRLQAAQKAQVTKKNKEIKKLKQDNNLEPELQKKIEALIVANDELKKDNKKLKNIVDQIKLKLAIDTKQLLQYKDSEIRQGLIKLFKWTLG
jgi:CRISPR/Cas system CMR subunit Cmr4 (Cas7 group RAMP superfamily)